MNHLFRNDRYVTRNEDKYGPEIVVWFGFRPQSYICAFICDVGDTVHLDPNQLKHMSYSRKPLEYWAINPDETHAYVISTEMLSSRDLTQPMGVSVELADCFCITLEGI